MKRMDIDEYRAANGRSSAAELIHKHEQMKDRIQAGIEFFRKEALDLQEENVPNDDPRMQKLESQVDQFEAWVKVTMDQLEEELAQYDADYRVVRSNWL